MVLVKFGQDHLPSIRECDAFIFLFTDDYGKFVVVGLTVCPYRSFLKVSRQYHFDCLQQFCKESHVEIQK